MVIGGRLTYPTCDGVNVGNVESPALSGLDRMRALYRMCYSGTRLARACFWHTRLVHRSPVHQKNTKQKQGVNGCVGVSVVRFRPRPPPDFVGKPRPVRWSGLFYNLGEFSTKARVESVQSSRSSSRVSLCVILGSRFGLVIVLTLALTRQRCPTTSLVFPRASRCATANSRETVPQMDSPDS